MFLFSLDVFSYIVGSDVRRVDGGARVIRRNA